MFDNIINKILKLDSTKLYVKDFIKIINNNNKKNRLKEGVVASFFFIYNKSANTNLKLE